MNEALGKAARQLVEHIESTIDYKRAVNHIEHLWLQKQIEIRPESLEEKIISSELSNSKKRALTKTTRILVNKKFRLTEEYRGRLFQKDINNISLSFFKEMFGKYTKSELLKTKNVGKKGLSTLVNLLNEN